MRRSSLVWTGALLVGGGMAVLLAGAFVLTNNARHGHISSAVYIGIGMVVLGLAAFAGVGVSWVFRGRKPGAS